MSELWFLIEFKAVVKEEKNRSTSDMKTITGTIRLPATDTEDGLPTEEQLEKWETEIKEYLKKRSEIQNVYSVGLQHWSPFIKRA